MTEISERALELLCGLDIEDSPVADGHLRQIQDALDAERAETEHAALKEAEAEKRCEDCAMELVDGGEGVGWRCPRRACHAYRTALDAQPQLHARIASLEARLAVSERARALVHAVLYRSGTPGPLREATMVACIGFVQAALDAERQEAEQRERERWAVEFLLAASRIETPDEDDHVADGANVSADMLRRMAVRLRENR